eukprot:6929348-Prymnesium_polylepis.1
MHPPLLLLPHHAESVHEVEEGRTQGCPDTSACSRAGPPSAFAPRASPLAAAAARPPSPATPPRAPTAPPLPVATPAPSSRRTLA